MNNNEEQTPRNVITQYLSNLSPREEANLEDRILDSFHNVLDPILNKDIHTLGGVPSVAFPSSFPSSSSSGRTSGDSNTSTTKDKEPPSSDVVLTLRLPTLLHPSIATIKADILHTVWREVFLAAREKAGLDLNNDE